jgi:sialate O-acetylesterase
LAETYQKAIAAYKSPMFKSLELNKDKAIYFFDNAPNGFMVKGSGKATEFYIAGQIKSFCRQKLNWKRTGSLFTINK